MATALKERLATELTRIQSEATKLAEKDERTDATEANLRALLDEGKSIKARFDELDVIEGLTPVGSGRVDERQERKDTPPQTMSPGELFIRSDAFTTYAARGSTPRFTLDAEHLLLTRALPMTTTGWAGAIQQPPPRDITAPLAPTPLLDLIPGIPWTSDVVTYVTYAKTAGGATVVAEGAAKPSAEWTPTPTTTPLKKIAVYTEATRELLEAPGAVRAKIDTLLVNEVRREAEAQAAAALAGATLPTATSTDLMRAIRVGIGTVQAAGFQPNAVLLNPADWAELDIEVFFQTNSGTSINSQFWGLRPVSSPAQPAGTATVGDFSSGMERYVRSAMQVLITDSHAGNFILNVFTILAETRELTAVVRPAAMVECAAGAGALSAPASKKG